MRSGVRSNHTIFLNQIYHNKGQSTAGAKIASITPYKTPAKDVRVDMIYEHEERGSAWSCIQLLQMSSRERDGRKYVDLGKPGVCSGGNFVEEVVEVEAPNLKYTPKNYHLKMNI